MRFFWRMLFNLVGFIFLLTIFTVSGAWTVLTLSITDEILSKAITNLAEDQSGSKFTFQRLHFNSLTGISISGVELFAPEGSRGYRQGGAIQLEPFVRIGEIKLEVRLVSLLKGSLELKFIGVRDVSIQMIENSAIDAITAYREKRFGSGDLHVVSVNQQDDPDKETTVEHENESFTLLPFDPQLLYLPFQLSINKIGFENLSLVYSSTKVPMKASEFLFRNVSFALHGDWQGNRSTFGVRFNNAQNMPIEIQANRNGVIDKSNGIVDLDINLINMRELKIALQANLHNIEKSGVRYDNQILKANFTTKLTEDRKGIIISPSMLQFGEAINYGLEGYVDFQAADKMKINLVQNASMDLKILADLIEPIFKIKANGKISVNDLKSYGSIDLSSLKSLDELVIPQVSGSVVSEDVSIEMGELSIRSVDGSINLSASPLLHANDASGVIDINTQQIRYKPKNSPIHIDINQIKLGSTVQISYKKENGKGSLNREMPIDIPILKVLFESPRIVISGGETPQTVFPLHIELDGDAQGGFKDIDIAVRGEIGNLLDIVTSIRCSAGCKESRIESQIKLQSISEIFESIKPTIGKNVPQEFVPSFVRGQIDSQLSMKCKIPSLDLENVQDFLNMAEMRFSGIVLLNDISMEVPFSGISMKNFDQRFNISGDLKEQRFELTQGFEKYSMNLLKNDAKSRLDLSQAKWEISLLNRFKDKISIKDLPKSMESEFDLRVYVGEITAPKFVHQDLSGFEFRADVNHKNASMWRINRIRLKVPDFGASFDLSGDALIDSDYKLSSFDQKLELRIDHGGQKTLPFDIRTGGEMALTLQVKSPDMKDIDAEGKIELNHFNFALINKNDRDRNIISIDDVLGEIPFKQRINISSIYENKLVNVDAENKLDKNGYDLARKSDIGEEIDAYFAKIEDKFSDENNRMISADYGSIRAFYPERKPIYIKRIEGFNLDLNEMEFDFELKQNAISLNQFSVNFLDGKVQGDMQIGFSPKPTALNLSIHMTRLNSRNLLDKFPDLKSRRSFSLMGSNPYIDATAHLQFDFLSKDMNGGLEITSIGHEQLKMLLFYVDPEEKNATISDIRTALNFGDVRLVKIPIKSGEIGLEVDVRLLGAPLPTPKISRFPIAQILRNFESQKVNEGDKSENRGKELNDGSNSVNSNSNG